MEERSPLGWRADTIRERLATPQDIERMDDVTAIAKIDELVGAAREAVAAGDAPASRMLYANACDVVEHNLLAPEVIGEFADALAAQGEAELAAEYRDWHRAFTETLADYGLPFPGYEERLRAKVAERAVATGQPRQRLGDSVEQARSASGLVGPQQAREQPRALPEALRPRELA